MYVLYGDDFGVRISDTAPAEARCPACDELLDCRYVPAQLETRRRLVRDVKCSYEGAVIVSERFVEFCRSERFRGMRFRPMRTKLEQLFVLGSDLPVVTDVKRGPVLFGRQCDACGNYEEVTQVLPLYLKPSSLPIEPDCFYETDLCAGHPRYKSRMIVVGQAVRDRLAKSGLKGLYFEPVEE